MNLISINIYRDRIQFEVFSIYNDKRDIIIQNEIIIPVSFSMGDKLEYIRKFMSMIINQNKVQYINNEAPGVRISSNIFIGFLRDCNGQ